MNGRKDAFSTYHPAVSFIYFGIIFLFSCFCTHPICLLISLFCSVCYYVHIKGARAVGFLLKVILPLVLFAMIINPLFSHSGVTILWYFPSGNPLTLESILYGVSAGVLLADILIWFACFSENVTSDKFVYLFGRILPAFSLLLSMTLRFIPRFKAQFDNVKDVQRALGCDTENGGVLKRIRNAITCFSIVVTWSLENSIETSDSMKSRGYGMGRRTAYSIYNFSERDRSALLLILLSGAVLFAALISGNLLWRYYPSIRGAELAPMTMLAEAVFLMFCLIPIIIDKKEEALWKRLESKI